MFETTRDPFAFDLTRSGFGATKLSALTETAIDLAIEAVA
jgi:hypothetical protein